MNAILQAALAYATAGIPVFPCASDKRPRTKHGYKDATTDPAVIADWWGQWPDALIGVPTGAASGIAVLDLDVKPDKGKDGTAHVPDWQSRSHIIARTQGGGVHLYFKAEGAPHCTSDVIAVGVDTRGNGGYVVAPPSPGYTWLNGSDFSTLPLWPDDLRPKKKERQRKPALTDSSNAAARYLDDSPLAAAVLAMHNRDVGWDSWNEVGMAIWGATSGSEAGRALWHVYSKKSEKKYDPTETDARWDHYATSPPTELGAGTLYHLAEEASPGWRATYARLHFSCDSNGKPTNISQRNIRTALGLLGVSVRHDTFADRLLVSGLEGHELLDDAALEHLWLLVDEKFFFRPTRDLFWTVVGVAARRNGFHPVRDYLDGLKWDGVPRLDKWLIDYGGAPDTEYVRAVGPIVLIAAVRRVRKPGVKFDEMLILESKQGADKSGTLEALAVKPEWFSDDLPLGADGKRVIEQTQGRWIVEAAELSGMRKADVEHLKSMLSRQVDKARLAYGRMPVERPRQWIVVGTTNNHQYLKDLTGNRRFWPVATPLFDVKKLREDREQLWAEAAAREANGESIRLDPRFWGVAAVEQEERTVDDPWIEIIARVLGDREGKILAADAWLLVGVPTGQATQEHNARLGKAMRALGWERAKLRFGGKNPEWCYCPGGGSRSLLKRILVQRKPGETEPWVGYEDEPQPF